MHYLKVFAFALLALLLGCTDSAKVSTQALIYCSEGSPLFFNPQLAIDGATYNASSRTIYNRLVDFRLGTNEIIPSLAESWKISDDGKEYEFKLRQDVPFHTTAYFQPTRNFNAQDVVFSFGRMRDPQNPFHQINGGDYAYFRSLGMGELIESITATDDYTVVFRLKRPEAPFLASLAMDFTSILSAEYGGELVNQGKLEKLDWLPVGTGPFLYSKYVKDVMIEYKTNEDFKLSAPAHFSKLIFAITPDPEIRYQKLANRECHIVGEPNPSDLKRYSKLPFAEVVRRPGMNVGYLALNTTKPPFNKVKIRQAVNYGLNKRKYLEKVYLSLATEAIGVVPPMMWGAVSDTTYSYDPNKAKQLMEQAGYSNGFETELWYLPVGRPYNPNGKLLAEMMKRDLAVIGIKAKLVTDTWANYLERTKNGEHAMAQLGWTGDNADPDNFLSQLLSCNAVSGGANIARWCDNDFDDLVLKARSSSQLGVRKKFYIEAQRVFQKQAPWVPIAHTEIFRVHLKRIKNYFLSPMGTENFHQIKIQ